MNANYISDDQSVVFGARQNRDFATMPRHALCATFEIQESHKVLTRFMHVGLYINELSYPANYCATRANFNVVRVRKATNVAQIIRARVDARIHQVQPILTSYFRRERHDEVVRFHLDYGSASDYLTFRVVGLRNVQLRELFTL
jgi:hypothetical protein